MKLVRLTDLDIDEVSLVGRAANKRKFLLTKSKDSNMATEEYIVKADTKMKIVLDKLAIESTEKVKKALEPFQQLLTKADLSDGDKEVVTAAAKLLASMEGEVPQGIAEKLMSMCGAEPQSSPEGKQEEPPKPDEEAKQEAKQEDEEEKQEDEEMNKFAKGETPDFSKFPRGTRGIMQALWKSQKESTAKAQKLEADLRKSQDELKTKEYIEKAQAYPELPTTPEKLGRILKSIAEKDPSIQADVEQLFRAGCSAIKSERLTKRGTTQADYGNSAWDKIEKMAKDLVQKNAGNGLTFEKAIGFVVKQQPELYKQYLDEKQ